MRNLTLNRGAGRVEVPAGTYGTFTANRGTRLVLGVAGASEPAVYNLQGLTLNVESMLLVVGPVVINVARSGHRSTARRAISRTPAGCG